MAVTKIHPIKSTLHFAIDYILEKKKTDDQTLISTHMCFPTTAHLQFLQTRKENKANGTVLARHLIQSFLPGEVDQETAHKIGLELCKNILKDEYEFVLTTHIDKGHIHNHIIFNNVNFETGKCYQSNKRTYHQIRYTSDRLCKKYKLSIIDEHYQTYLKKHKTRGKSHYEWEQSQNGKGWKSYLQFLIDLNISRSNSWDDFLDRMKKSKCEIKFGKHIAFKCKNASRFTRSKTIGSDYIEERLKERIENNPPQQLIDTTKINDKKGLEFWVRKHNLKSMAQGLVELRNLGIQTKNDLELAIESIADKQILIQDEVKQIDKEMTELGKIMENLHVIQKNRLIYHHYQKQPNNRQFLKEYQKEITAYKKAKQGLSQNHKSANPKDILSQLEQLQEKKNTLMTEYSQIKFQFNKLYQHKKNFDYYFETEQDRNI
ncbi:type IV secretory pathway%2C VirD2 components (relaxase) [Streptococcus suis]|uniref:relaxase/mobilization nuclease domain-containing protein n=1 Tax=Streptococcus suis TaxID=1307 RepID=UPI0005CE7146|nr:relaxase/mobilization nuclease domain-containing protein [Streptococcus suis]NQG11346.1 relaxase/mobilization nuclease domain-containing protein [Streptococcus suis]NQR26273.1 relaxase/mobilization nuclease domain-containing protein [Streptococcus suis]CYW93130.1 type IV secretory pathway%2C VirD2 components (relaxase) [Streptococcus suis]HEM5632420.1 relaxase/mobilization nuclease domain-containing protein [Streptococcus suis]